MKMRRGGITVDVREPDASLYARAGYDPVVNSAPKKKQEQKPQPEEKEGK